MTAFAETLTAPAPEIAPAQVQADAISKVAPDATETVADGDSCPEVERSVTPLEMVTDGVMISPSPARVSVPEPEIVRDPNTRLSLTVNVVSSGIEITTASLPELGSLSLQLDDTSSPKRFPLESAVYVYVPDGASTATIWIAAMQER